MADVLVLALEAEARLTCQFLKEGGVDAAPGAGVDALAELIVEGKLGVAIVAEEALVRTGAFDLLRRALARQPAWSEVPVIFFASSTGDRERLEKLAQTTTFTILERPVRRSTLLSSVRAAVAARRRQWEVRELVARLEDANRRKDEFLAMLGHELRNPLHALRSALYLEKTTEGFSRHLEICDRQARHLSKIVDDLLDVSRVTHGKIQLEPERADLRDLVNRCAEAFDGEARDRGHDLIAVVGDQPLPVHVDVVRIEQILANLVSNAIKYTPNRGRIELEARGDADRAVVMVRDNGVGIAPDLLPRVFDVFRQGDGSLARSSGGLGLGLAVVKSLVEKHGGSVVARSDGVGCGTEMILTLPLDPSVVSAEGAALPDLVRDVVGSIAEADLGLHRTITPTGMRADAPLRLVVIEDHDDNREVLRMFLEGLGHDVEVAADGAAGVDLILRARPDVALVDIGLPLLDGYEVARQVRKRGGADLCLVAMTGYGQPEDRQRAAEAGFGWHLVKPIEPGELVALVKKIAAAAPSSSAAPASSSSSSSSLLSSSSH